MFYYLMRKNDNLALIDINKNGINEVVDTFDNNIDLLPLCQKKDISNSLREWWNDRAVPLTQMGIQEILHKNNVSVPAEFLLKNLGLSLTDYYWIKPIDSELTWEQVNLFTNNFDSVVDFQIKGSNEKAYTPNASLQGDLEKYWAINEKGERILIKGNSDAFSRESINEVIVSKINKLQDYDNYVDYNLLSMKNRKYKYACFCNNFIDLDNEFISAYSIINSQKKRNHINYLEHFKNICVENGMNREQLQHDLDYMLFLDFIVTNTDRHLNNFGVIRDAKTLKFKRLAPIFDSGCSLFVGNTIPRTYYDFAHIKINSINTTEAKQINNIQDKLVFDLDRIPERKYIIEMFEKDDNLIKSFPTLPIDIADSFELKIKIAKNLQEGKKIYSNNKGFGK